MDENKLNDEKILTIIMSFFVAFILLFLMFKILLF